MKLKKIISATTVAAGMIVATQANAIQWLFDAVGDTFTANYAYTQDGATINADITFTLDSWSTNSATFSVDIDNTLTSGPGTNRIVSFGIDVIAPTLATVTTSTNTSSNNWDADLNATLPGFQTVDLCTFAGNNCPGGSNDGVFEGTSDSLGLTLTTLGNFQTNGITFTSPFATKWQSVGTSEKSYEWDTTSSSTSGSTTSSSTSGSTTSSTTSGSTTSSTGGTEISEPGILALLGIGLLGQAFLLISRRRRLGM